MSEVHDVVIIGSGPAGWTAAIYTARAGLKPLVLAGSLEPGGALMTTTEVENFPGWPEGILGPELMDKMQEQAEKFGAKVEYDDAIKVLLDREIKIIHTETAEYQARTVILALGSAYRKLDLADAELFSGKGVSYCATCDGFFFKDQEITVVGGGDSAVTEALFLTRFGSKVNLVHRRNELRASKVLSNRLLANEKINVYWNSQVVALQGDESGKLVSLTLRNTIDGSEFSVPTAGLFIAIGHDPRSQIVADEIELDPSGYIKVASPSTATNIAGVFACGDVVDHRYRQAITAAGSGCAAAIDAQEYLAAFND